MAAPENNTNAEKWTLQEAEMFLGNALDFSKRGDYDFIGEIARDMGSYIDVFDYLIGKFPHLKSIKDHIMRNCEANCFSNGKKGSINSALAIMNLKSNHKWTDRSATDITTDGKPIKEEIDYTKLSSEALKEIAGLKSE